MGHGGRTYVKVASHCLWQIWSGSNSTFPKNTAKVIISSSSWKNYVLRVRAHLFLTVLLPWYVRKSVPKRIYWQIGYYKFLERDKRLDTPTYKALWDIHCVLHGNWLQILFQGPSTYMKNLLSKQINDSLAQNNSLILLKKCLISNFALLLLIVRTCFKPVCCQNNKPPVSVLNWKTVKEFSCRKV